jgi:phage baseplate assembly protein W
MDITFPSRTPTSVLPKTEYFSDFLVNLDPHPDNNQLVKNVNEKAVIRSIRNLLFTNKYERLFQPDIGCEINKILFEPLTPASVSALKTVIETTIQRYEPRAGLLEVIVTPYIEQNLLVVTIKFFISNSQQPVSFTVQLSRVR